LILGWARLYNVVKLPICDRPDCVGADFP